MGDIIHNISRVDQAVCWPDFTAPYSTKPSAELSSCFRLTLSCCSTTSTVDEVQRYARFVIYALVHVMLSYLLWFTPLCPGRNLAPTKLSLSFPAFVVHVQTSSSRASRSASRTNCTQAMLLPPVRTVDLPYSF